MAQARFQLPPGTTAYIGDKPYKSGQFMPGGVTSYSLIWTTESTPEEVAAGAKSSINNMIFVAVGTSRQAIADRMAATEETTSKEWETFRQVYGQITENQDAQSIAETEADDEEQFPFGANEP
jgi:hypothetical protein